MANLGNFDANQVDPKTSFDPLPAGKYLVAIIESKMKPTKSGAGEYLELKFQVLEGEYTGRFLWSRLNLKNANQETVKIARAELSAICRSVNVMAPRDSVELHNLPLVLGVKVVKRKDSGELDNRISKYEKREVQAAAPAAQTQSAPWRR